MLKAVLLAVGTAALLSTIPAQAQQQSAPGQKMQKKGSVKGTTGASGYAPGHADSNKK